MADLKITELDPVINPNTAVDLFAVVSDGVTKKTTIDQFITDYLVGAPNIGSDSDWLGPGQTDNTAAVYRTGEVSIGLTNSGTYILDVQDDGYAILSNFDNTQTGAGDFVGLKSVASGAGAALRKRTGIIGDANNGESYSIGVQAGNWTDPATITDVTVGLMAAFTTQVNTNNYAAYIQGDGTSTNNLYGLYIKGGNSGAGEGFSLWIEDGTEGAGKVLTSDANGKATWAVTSGVGGSATVGSIPYMVTDTTTITTSPLTSDGTHMFIENGHLNIGTAVDDDNLLFVKGGAADEYVVWFQTEYTGGGAVALNGVADGVHGAYNRGIDIYAENSTVQNIGIQAGGGSSGTTGVIATAHSIINIGGGFSAHSVDASAEIASAITGHAAVNTTADVYGLDILVSNAGAGTAYALRLDDGTQSAGYVLTSDADGKANWAAPVAATVLAAGSNKEIQFNDATARAGDSDLLWDKAINTLTVGTTAIGVETITITLANGGATSALTSTSTKTDAIGTAITGVAVTSSAFDNIAASLTAANAGAGDAFALKTFGQVAFDDTKIGFFGATPVVRTAAYSVTNVTPDRDYDANASTTDELADVLGTVIADLTLYGLFQ